MKKQINPIPGTALAIVALTLALAAPQPSAHAAASPTTIAVDTFDYSAGPANGLNGGDGFDGSYSGGGNITAGSLSYIDANGSVMPASSNRFTTLGQGFVPIFRNLRTNGQPSGVIDGNGKFGADGAVIYIALLARLETGDNSGFGGFSLYDDSTERLFIGDPGFCCYTNWGIDATPGVFQSAALVTGTTRLLVARIDFAAGNETIRLYVDPPLAGEPALPAVGPVTRPDFRFNRIRFASGAGNGAPTSGGTHSFDELRMGTTYAGVVKQPTVEITQQPTNQLVFAGSNATFRVSATTTNLPLSYQWRFNGTNIAGATSDSLTISNVQPAHVGNYNVLVSDTTSMAISALASLSLLTPYIITQPTNLAVGVNSNATFTVTAGGAPLFFYQWQFNGANLANKTNAPLVITNVQPPQFGSYAVVITNSYGAVTSTVVTLQLLQIPTIVQQPQPVTVVVGENATFTVAVTNTAMLPITYRWIRQGTPFATNVLNSTTCSMTLVDVRTNTAGFTNGPGTFRVIAINTAGGVGSTNVLLTVVTATAPSVVTLAVTNVRATSATLTGAVNPNGATTSVRFEYGLTASYGSNTPTFVIGNGTNSISVSNLVTGLSPTTAYHFRIVASNSGGTNFGGDQAFTTTQTPTAPVLVAPIRQGNQFNVSLGTVIGSAYYLERMISLSDSNWTAVANLPGNGLVQSLADLFATNSQSFYRVRIE